MGTECSTFTLSTWNCTAGKGRTGWNAGALNGAEAALEVEGEKDSIKKGYMLIWGGTNALASLGLQHYLASQDDGQQCVQKVELCHGDGDWDLQQCETCEPGRNELLQSWYLLRWSRPTVLINHFYPHRCRKTTTSVLKIKYLNIVCNGLQTL